MKLSLLVFVPVVFFATLVAQASLVFPQRIEEVGAEVAAVWQVKVTKVERTENHFRLKDGKVGPVTSTQYTYTCEVPATVYGTAPADGAKTVKLTHTAIIPIKYDENGKPEVFFSYYSTGTGMEAGMKEGQEYLVCLRIVRGVEAYPIMRTDPLEGKQALLDGIAQACCWKIVNQKHPEWKQNIRFATFDPKVGLIVVVKGTKTSDHLALVAPASDALLTGEVGQDVIQVSPDAAKKQILLRTREGKVWAHGLESLKPESPSTPPATAPATK